MNGGAGGDPLDPLEGGDTEPNVIVPEPIVEEVTNSVCIRACTECGRPVFAMAI